MQNEPLSFNLIIPNPNFSKFDIWVKLDEVIWQMLWPCRFTNADDKRWFENAIDNVCKQNIGEDYLSLLPAESFFVDFLRDAPEPTGDEPEDAVLDAPKIYELVILYFLNSVFFCLLHELGICDATL